MTLFQKLRERLVGRVEEQKKIPPRENPNCPVCQTALENLQGGECALYFCGPCGGLWMRPSTLDALLQSDQSVVEDYFTEAKEGMDHKLNDRAPARKCPDCDAPMDNFMFAYTSEVWVDSCPNDHGVWLDGGELKQLWDYEQRKNNPTPEEQGRLAAALMTMLDDSSRMIARETEMKRPTIEH